jgi:hypothetical protein
LNNSSSQLILVFKLAVPTSTEIRTIVTLQKQGKTPLLLSPLLDLLQAIFNCPLLEQLCTLY